MVNVAKDIIWPTDKTILVRVVFLYVGQGESTIILVADGGTYKALLIDINRDTKNGGIDVARLMADLLKDEGKRLGVFVNTHPHNDHLAGILELSDALSIDEVWHSGHKPGKDHCDAYENLQKVIRKVKEAGGTETKLLGSRSPKNIGKAEYYVLAPAEYVVDDIAGETGETRYRRIHEHCAVLKFGTGSSWVMITGDADRDAWEKHIADYHKDRLGAVVLSAAHHCSRTFFRYNEKDEPYLVALERIAPEYVVISAPTRKESPHGHPHEDALKFYADEVGEDNILHTGEQRHSFICDIFSDGKYTIQSENGDLAEEYSLEDEEGNGGGEKKKTLKSPIIVTTRVDHRPMGKK